MRKPIVRTLAKNPNMLPRFGLGFDIHRLEPDPGGSIMLGGYTVSCDYKLVAHSDGDVVLHAVTDAILGALALGDIGEWFPDTDPQHAQRASYQTFFAPSLRTNA